MGFYDNQSSPKNTKGLAQDEIQPPYDDESRQPKTMTTTMKRDGVLYVAGKPPMDNLPTEIMFIATAVQEEEASEGHTSHYGMKFKQEAEYLRGPIGDMFKDVCSRALIDIRKCYYTSVVKWLLPRAMRGKPAMKVLKWGMPVLLDEIRKAKPKIIVCLGKPAFDLLADTKIGFDDATGGWFWSSKAEAHIYVMRSPTELLMKPELFEGFRVDLTEVRRKLDLINEVDGIADLPVRIQVIRSAEHLRDWVAQMQEEGHKLFSVDGEWHGNTHIDGNLRSLQLAWTDSDAIYIRFQNEQNEWDFELEDDEEEQERFCDIADDHCLSLGLTASAVRGGPEWLEGLKKARYAAVGKILQPLLNQKDVKYVGHHYVADALWMQHWLGLDVLHKCYMDTEFAQQTIDEASELKLERGISMKYTTLGRYDIDLILWKKKNKKLCEDGYGYIPDDILIPYASRDVLAVFRAVPMIRKQMHFQKLEDYYDTIFGPFVTDVFYEFAAVGLPMDIPLMDELRELFNFAKRELDREFKQKVYKDAKQRLMAKLIEILGPLKMAQCMAITKDVVAMVADGQHEQAWTCLKAEIPLDQMITFRNILDHLIVSPDFNIRSAPDMRRWLFDVSGMTPIKSTNRKAMGMPSMDWSKVLELTPEQQRNYTPACDKQTLQILAEKLPLVDELLDLNVVGNLCKAFLKEAEVYYDEDLGEEVEEEAGLHQWLASDGRIHGQTSTTETGRPRGWRPNSLNWPSYVNKRIGKAMARVIAASVAARDVKLSNEERIKQGLPLPLPDSLMKWSFIKTEKDIPSIRSIVKAPPGWCVVENDYQTAEIRGLAFISGDENLIRLMTEKDPEWAWTKDGKKVRVLWADAKDSGIPKAMHNERYLLGTWEGGKQIKQYTEEDLLRNEQTGAVIHCNYDLHWSLAEWTYEQPREMMVEKIHRAAGKVGNFSSAYGASPASLERKIESDTGIKPEEGTGQKLLDAIRARQPRATEFLEQMQEVPKKQGWYRAASGRIRHCVMHASDSGVGYRTRNSIESAVGREMRNFPMQESVASTAARAGIELNKFYRKLGMKARVMTILYDSVVTLCPLEERFMCARLHEVYMFEENHWTYTDDLGTRKLSYPTDTELNYRWSTKPSDDEKKQLEDPTWHPTPDRWKFVETMKFSFS